MAEARNRRFVLIHGLIEDVRDRAHALNPACNLPCQRNASFQVAAEIDFLRARKLADTNMRVIGSPKYFYEHGVPQKIDDLSQHKLLHFSNQSSGNAWKMTSPTGEKRLIRAGGSLTVNDGQSLLQAAEAGLGIAYLPSFLYHEAVEDGRLKVVLPDLPVETLGIHVVYPPGLYTQPKLRAFIDFLAEHFRGKGPESW